MLVDDDVELGALMKEFFSAKGISLACAYTGEAGLNQALEGSFDLVLLDVMLPQLDGFAVLEGLRRRSSVPVIMLTSRTEQEARIQGLNAGADDYLPKPFSPDALLARIQAVLRRAGRTPALKPEVLEANSVRINPASREVFYHGTPVSSNRL